MTNLVVEVVGLTLILASLVTLAVVAGSVSWQVGALAGAGESLFCGIAAVVWANRRPVRREP